MDGQIEGLDGEIRGKDQLMVKIRHREEQQRELLENQKKREELQAEFTKKEALLEQAGKDREACAGLEERIQAALKNLEKFDSLDENQEAWQAGEGEIACQKRRREDLESKKQALEAALQEEQEKRKYAWRAKRAISCAGSRNCGDPATDWPGRRGSRAWRSKPLPEVGIDSRRFRNGLRRIRKKQKYWGIGRAFWPRWSRRRSTWRAGRNPGGYAKERGKRRPKRKSRSGQL